MTQDTQEPKGLGGWLIVPAIGLFVLPFRLLTSLHSDFLPIFREGYWEILTTPGREAYHPLWAPLITFEVMGNALFVVFDLVLIYLFFTKSHRFPYLFIAFIVANVVFVVSDYFVAGLIPAVAAQKDTESIREMIRAVSTAIIWVPYFLVSQRVKNTFVRQVSESHRTAAARAN